MKRILLTIISIFIFSSSAAEDCIDNNYNSNNTTSISNDCKQHVDNKSELKADNNYQSKRGFSTVAFVGSVVFSLILIFIFKNFRDIKKARKD